MVTTEQLTYVIGFLVMCGIIVAIALHAGQRLKEKDRIYDRNVQALTSVIIDSFVFDSGIERPMCNAVSNALGYSSLPSGTQATLYRQLAMYIKTEDLRDSLIESANILECNEEPIEVC